MIRYIDSCSCSPRRVCHDSGMSCMRRAHNVFVQPPDGFATSLACHVRAEGASIYIIVLVQPSTGLPRLWHVAYACSPRRVCHVSGMSRVRTRIFQSQIVFVQPSTGLQRLSHVICAELFISGMSYAQSYSFQCSLVRGTVALVQPSTGLPRLWHVACAELFFQERTRGKARWPAVLGSASQGTERAVPHKLTRGKARWLAVLGSASHRHCVIASMRVAVLAETPRTVAAFLCTLAAPQVGGALQHIHITLAS